MTDVAGEILDTGFRAIAERELAALAQRAPGRGADELLRDYGGPRPYRGVNGVGSKGGADVADQGGQTLAEATAAVEAAQNDRIRAAQVSLLHNIDLPETAAKLVRVQKEANRAYVEHVEAQIESAIEQLRKGLEEVKKLVAAEDATKEAKIRLTQMLMTQVRAVPDFVASIVKQAPDAETSNESAQPAA